jgi:hypothetical protein
VYSLADTEICLSAAAKVSSLAHIGESVPLAAHRMRIEGMPMDFRSLVLLLLIDSKSFLRKSRRLSRCAALAICLCQHGFAA